MRLTQVLRGQHAGRMFIFNWHHKSKIKISDYGSKDDLLAQGIPIIDACEFLKPKYENINLKIVGFEAGPVKNDKTHPNWHNRRCLFYRDTDVLLEGTQQAKCLTKTIDLSNEIKLNIRRDYDYDRVDKNVRKIIKLSKIFDAQQEKLPVVKDPARPAWNFRRSYGIVDERVNTIILSNLIQLCENVSDKEIVSQRFLTRKAHFSFPLEQFGDLIQFQLRSDFMLSAATPLKPFCGIDTQHFELSNLQPVKETITLSPTNIYTLQNVYPLNRQFSKYHPHTIFVHYNGTEVKNLYEEPVNEDQIVARSLMKSFTVAAAYARIRFGENVKDLPEPISIQCIQTDGKDFYFSKFQLNTLNFDSRNGIKNIWCNYPKLELYSNCSYQNAIPILNDYNPEVFEYFYNFYQSN